MQCKHRSRLYKEGKLVLGKDIVLIPGTGNIKICQKEEDLILT